MSALVTTTAASGPVGAAPLNRPADPVVLTGANLPTLQTAKPNQLLGFAARTTGWQQVPIQIDERALLNFGRVYHGATNNVNVLGYTSPKTWAGKDPTPTFDANDELAFMARDAGILSPFATGPSGTVAGILEAFQASGAIMNALFESGDISLTYDFSERGDTLAGGSRIVPFDCRDSKG